MNSPCQYPNLGEKLDDIHKDIRTIMVNQGVDRTDLNWVKGTSKIVITVLIPLIISVLVALYRSKGL